MSVFNRGSKGSRILQLALERSFIISSEPVEPDGSSIGNQETSTDCTLLEVPKNQRKTLTKTPDENYIISSIKNENLDLDYASITNFVFRNTNKIPPIMNNQGDDVYNKTFQSSGSEYQPSQDEDIPEENEVEREGTLNKDSSPVEEIDQLSNGWTNKRKRKSKGEWKRAKNANLRPLGEDYVEFEKILFKSTIKLQKRLNEV